MWAVGMETGQIRTICRSGGWFAVTSGLSFSLFLFFKWTVDGRQVSSNSAIRRFPSATQYVTKVKAYLTYLGKESCNLRKLKTCVSGHQSGLHQLAVGFVPE